MPITASKSDTRQRLIEAARDLFLERGYEGTSIAMILKKAGVNAGSLYYFFPAKEDLLIAVLEWYKANLWSEVLDPVFNNVSDPIERIFGVLDGYRQMLTFTKCTMGCPIGNLALELADTHPNVRPLINENFDNWKKAIEQCLNDARDRLPRNTDTRQLASFVLTVMEGGVMQAKSYKSLKPFEAAVKQLRNYFDHLLQRRQS